MKITERLNVLRELMKEKKIDAYLVPTDDFHGSEYVGDYFKCRKYITGFTGSAGTAVIMKDMAGLWTDGRYFIQAADQLKGSTIELFKSGEPGVPTVHEFLKEKLEQIKAEAVAKIQEADVPEKLNDVRVKFLGKKGELTAVLKGMKDVAPEERPKVGQLVNDTRAAIEELLEESKAKMEKAIREEKMKAEVIDALHRIEGHTECLIESAKEKALYAGEKVADRVANETSVIAEKANDIKGKVHSMADEAKK